MAISRPVGISYLRLIPLNPSINRNGLRLNSSRDRRRCVWKRQNTHPVAHVCSPLSRFWSDFPDNWEVTHLSLVDIFIKTNIMQGSRNYRMRKGEKKAVNHCPRLAADKWKKKANTSSNLRLALEALFVFLFCFISFSSFCFRLPFFHLIRPQVHTGKRCAASLQSMRNMVGG